MKNNHRKRFNRYTQGQRWTIRVLLILGVFSGIPQKALAVFPGPAKMVQCVVAYVLLGGASSLRTEGVGRSLEESVKEEAIGNARTLLEEAAYCLVAGCAYLKVGKGLFYYDFNKPDSTWKPETDRALYAINNITAASDILKELRNKITPGQQYESYNDLGLHAKIRKAVVIEKTLKEKCGDPHDPKGGDWLRFPITVNGSVAALAKSCSDLEMAKADISHSIYSDDDNIQNLIKNTTGYMQNAQNLLNLIKETLPDETPVPGSDTIACIELDEEYFLSPEIVAELISV